VFSLTGFPPYEAMPKRDWDFIVLPLMGVAFLGLGSVMLFGCAGG
jgi:hypothetical protein